PICLEEYLARVRKQDEANHDGDEPPGDNPPAATGSASRKHRKAGDPNFRNETFRNATHRSKTDPDARLYAKGSHQEAKLRYMVHNLMDVRSGEPGSETSLHGSQPDGRSLGCDPGSMRHTLLGDGGARGGAGDGTFGETHGVGSWLPAWRRQLHGRCVP